MDRGRDRDVDDVPGGKRRNVEENNHRRTMEPGSMPGLDGLERDNWPVILGGVLIVATAVTAMLVVPVTSLWFPPVTLFAGVVVGVGGNGEGNPVNRAMTAVVGGTLVGSLLVIGLSYAGVSVPASAPARVGVLLVGSVVVALVAGVFALGGSVVADWVGEDEEAEVDFLDS